MPKLLTDEPRPDRCGIDKGIFGNLCRCTGYHFIVDAVREAAAILRGEHTTEAAG